MEFRLDGGQEELQDTVRRFCAARFPLDRIAEREGAPVDRVAWKELADLGVLGLLVPGEGLGAIEAAVVFEQVGEHLVPGPLLWSVLGAPFVDGAATGDRVIAGCDGQLPLVVEHAADADVLVILRREGVFACERDDLPPSRPLAPLDPLTPAAELDALPAGDQVGDAAAAEHLRTTGTLLAAAMLLGVSSRALEVARAHALEREQFGVPIGSFQAIKHLLADMYVRDGLARSATYAAAAVVDDPTIGDVAATVAGAKLLAGEAAVANAGTAIQVLGGMGFTWDMLSNHLLKRAWVLDLAFGTGDDHALAIGSALA